MNKTTQHPLGRQQQPAIDLVNEAWLEAVLADNGVVTKIQKIDLQPIGTGQLGSTVRLSIRYQPGHAGPSSLILKYAADDENSLQVAKNWSLYQREIHFYNQLSQQAKISLPFCYCARLFGDSDFLLLMEDLSDYAPGDQMQGAALDNIKQAALEAAKLHAATWRIDAGSYPWLEAGLIAQPFYSAEVFRAVWPQFYGRYADQLTPLHISVCEALANNYERYEALPDSPRCVTHNDFRLDNMLFSSAGAIKVVDWQSVALGFGAVDIAYLIAGAFSPQDRRKVENEVLQYYLQELHEQGVTDYTDDQLQRDYSHFSFAGINVAVGAAMLVQRTERGDRLFLTMLDRHVQHVLDWNALSIFS